MSAVTQVISDTELVLSKRIDHARFDYTGGRSDYGHSENEAQDYVISKPSIFTNSNDQDGVVQHRPASTNSTTNVWTIAKWDLIIQTLEVCDLDC